MAVTSIVFEYTHFLIRIKQSWWIPAQEHKKFVNTADIHSHAPYTVQSYVLQTYVAKAKPENLADTLKARLPSTKTASVFLLVDFCIEQL